MRNKVEVGKALRTTLVPQLRSVDEKNRTIEFVASTEAVDRYGDIIRVAGWKLDAYKNNPIFLWAHRSGEPPIGKCVGIHVESNPPALVQKIEFADAATYTFADTVFNLYKGGFLNAVSVGFMPLEDPKRLLDADGNWTYGYEFTSQELLELSAVPVPANPEALARCVEKGFGEADLARVFTVPSPEQEFATLSIALSRLAVSIASATVRVALAELKAAGVQRELGGDLTYEDLLSAVQAAGANGANASASTVPSEITTIEQLGDALGSGDQEFEKALGLADEAEARHPSGSRKWRRP
jgi:hypothetical protein